MGMRAPQLESWQSGSMGLNGRSDGERFRPPVSHIDRVCFVVGTRELWCNDERWEFCPSKR